MTPFSSANSFAVTSLLSSIYSLSSPVKRDISTVCGVNITGQVQLLKAFIFSATAFIPSASIITGTFEYSSTLSTTSETSSHLPNPGPISTVSALSTSFKISSIAPAEIRPFLSLNGTVITSVVFASMAPLRLLGTASVTSPLPVVTAGCDDKYAAPVIPAEPAITSILP